MPVKPVGRGYTLKNSKENPGKLEKIFSDGTSQIMDPEDDRVNLDKMADNINKVFFEVYVPQLCELNSWEYIPTNLHFNGRIGKVTNWIYKQLIKLIVRLTKRRMTNYKIPLNNIRDLHIMHLQRDKYLIDSVDQNQFRYPRTISNPFS